MIPPDPMTKPPSNKKLLLSTLFAECRARGSYAFGKDEVRTIAQRLGFGNPFDATKIDHSDLLPDDVREAGYGVLRLGKGNFEFITPLHNLFHPMEKVPTENIKEIGYENSLLNNTDTSESSLLSLVYNQTIVSQFLYGKPNANPLLYFARHTNMPMNFKVGGREFSSKRLQMEMDMVLEHEGGVTTFEAKNKFPQDFAITQLYNPYRYFYEKQQTDIPGIKSINCCYVSRETNKDKTQQEVRFHLYDFADPMDLASIRFIRAASFTLKV